jgi:nucleoside-diphosphate-sugar epimerase
VRILVTGAAGLIGRHAADHLVRSGHDVVALLRGPGPERDDGLARAPREVIGDAADVSLLTDLCRDVDGVLHLAAIPSPGGHTARELVEANSISTITVLEAAGGSGVKAVVIASSISILGMAWSDALMSPIYLPIDEAHPLRPTEGYALSKECDEAAARMASRRWQMPVVALRFPYTNSRDAIVQRASDPLQEASLAKELWAYLDVRDAARACELALLAAAAGRVPGGTVLNVIADDVIVSQPLHELVERWHPSAVHWLDEYNGRGAYSVSAARESIGFSAGFLLDGTS